MAEAASSGPKISRVEVHKMAQFVAESVAHCAGLLWLLQPGEPGGDLGLCRAPPAGRARLLRQRALGHRPHSLDLVQDSSHV